MLSTSQALAWQTASRSRGLMNCERCQKVSGSGAKPMEFVEALAVGGHGFGGGECCGAGGVVGGVLWIGEGKCCLRVLFGDLLLERAFQVVHLEGRELRVGWLDDVVDVAPLLRPGLPSRWAGIMPSGRSAAGAVLLDEFESHIRMKLLIERLKLLPGGLELGGELGRRHVITGAPEVGRCP